MRSLAAVLLLAASCLAQDKISTPKVIKPCATVAKCRAEAQSFSDDNLALYSELSSKSAEIDQLKADKAALAEKNADLEKKLSELRDATTEVLKFNTKLQEEYFKSVNDRNHAAEQYNDLLNTMQASIERTAAVNERRERMANALALYQMMPKVQPYYLPPPTVFPITPPPARTNINCTSSTLGNYTTTNCN